MAQSDRDIRLMSLSTANWVVLFVIFFTTLAFSLAAIVAVFMNIVEFDGIEESAVALLMSASVSGVSIYYARKLYKSGINSHFSEANSEYSVPQISTIAYFLFRIPMAIAFSLLSYSLWRLSLITSIPADTELNESVRYSVTILGFFSGFSAGRLLTSFDERGVKFVDPADGS